MLRRIKKHPQPFTKRLGNCLFTKELRHTSFWNSTGTGSRMPNFQLTKSEATAIADELYKNASPPLSETEPQQLSPFSNRKAEALLETKLACVGCHQINGSGGKVAPNLDNVANRLKSAIISEMINEPQKYDKKNIMPLIPMPESYRKLITQYFQQKKSAKNEQSYLSLLDHPLTFPDENKGIQKVYITNCAPCHGENGNGRGFNVAYLPVYATAHNNAAYMKTRSNEAVHSGIAAGGFILARSHTMPPFRDLLSDETINALVEYIRKLCDCDQPSWAN